MKKTLLAVACLLAFSGAAQAQLQCSDASNTVMVTHKWGDYQRKKSVDYGSIGDNDAFIIKVQIPATVAPSTRLYSVFGAEWIDGRTLRYFNLSKYPCDFGTSTVGSSFGSYFAVNTTQVTRKYGRTVMKYPTFKPGETMYVNIKNDFGCYPTCNIFWAFQWR